MKKIPKTSIQKARANYEKNFIKVIARVNSSYNDQVACLLQQHGSQSKAVEYMLNCLSDNETANNNASKVAFQSLEEENKMLKERIASLEAQIETLNHQKHGEEEEDQAVSKLFSDYQQRLKSRGLGQAIDDAFNNYISSQDE